MIFIFLAKINKLLLPSFSKRHMSLGAAKKWQLAIIAYRFWVTKNAINH